MNMNFNILHYLKAASEECAQRVALNMSQNGKETTISFKELWDKVDRLSVALLEKGLKPGDRCIIMIPMSVDLYIVLLGIIKMGAVAVFVDPWIKHSQIAKFCAFAQPIGFVGVAKSHYLRLINRKLWNIPLTITDGNSFLGLPAKWTLRSLLNKYQGNQNIYSAQENDPALITFTSGSSGMPKGANRTHGFLTAQYKALSREFQYDENNIDMPMFPVFALSNLAAKITSIIPDMDFRKVSKINAQRIVKQMKRHKVNSCTASPPFYDRLVEYIIQTNDSPRYLNKCLTGGAPVSETQLKQWRNVLPDAKIDIVYGSTEAEPVAHISLEKRIEASNFSRGFCVGNPSSCVQCKVIKIIKDNIPPNTDWQQLISPQGEVGELIVTGDHVCKEYYQNIQAFNENKIVDCFGVVWHRMGDTGYFDERGSFWLVGRVHSTIIRDKNFYHAQLLEPAIKNIFPDAKKVAVVGISHPIMGEQIVVVITTNNDKYSARFILKNCLDKGIVVDKLLLTTESLPVDPRHNVKIDYNILLKNILSHNLKIYEKAENKQS